MPESRPESRGISPLDVLLGQAIALRHMADALILAIESLQVRPQPAPEVPAPAPLRPPHGVGEPPAVLPSSGLPIVPTRGYQTFDGPLAAPARPSTEAPVSAPAPDSSGDLQPSN